MGLKEWLTTPWGTKPEAPKTWDWTKLVQHVEPKPVVDPVLDSLLDTMKSKGSAFLNAVTFTRPEFQLDFCLENLKKYNGPYDAELQPSEAKSYFRALHEAAMASNDRVYGAISTKVNNSQYILALDCDGTDEMLAVCHVLKSYYGLKYATIISSPNHFWVIAEKIGTTYELVNMMEVIPGVDPRFVDCIKSRGKIVLRGMPKDMMPIFPDSIEFTNPLILKWYRAFKDLYRSEEMIHISRLRRLVKAIKEKKVAELASDPNFMI